MTSTATVRTLLVTTVLAAVVAIGLPSAVGAASKAPDTKTQSRLSQLLASGQGVPAAALIDQADLQASPRVLGAALYDAGVIASHVPGGAIRYGDAVAYALPHAAVPIADATVAFASGFGDGLTMPITAPLAYAGSLALTKTYVAYLLAPPR